MAAQQLAGADPEVDRRYAAADDRGERGGRVRGHEALVVGARERADPRVEELHGGGAGRGLHVEEGTGDLGQPGTQVVPQLRVAVHQRLGVLVVLARAALDEVAGQGERGAGEADEGGRPELGRQQPHGLGDVGDVVGGQLGQPVEVGARADRLGDDRARRPATMSRSTPTAASGTTMSEKKIAASTPWRRTGCRVISVTRSGRRHDSSMPTPSRTARYSGSDRPAWRMNHTGVWRARAARRAARTRAESVGGGHRRRF